MLDTTAEGVVMFDGEGNPMPATAAPRRCSAMTAPNLTQRNLADLFAPENQGAVRDYLEGLGDGVGGLLDQGREVLDGCAAARLPAVDDHGAELVPMRRTFFAVFRDLSQVRKNETELATARRGPARAAGAKADVLARIQP